MPDPLSHPPYMRRQHQHSRPRLTLSSNTSVCHSYANRWLPSSAIEDLEPLSLPGSLSQEFNTDASELEFPGEYKRPPPGNAVRTSRCPGVLLAATGSPHCMY